MRKLCILLVMGIVLTPMPLNMRRTPCLKQAGVYINGECWAQTHAYQSVMFQATYYGWRYK